MKIDEITANFALLDDWDDRYRYVIELGRTLQPLPEAARTDARSRAVISGALEFTKKFDIDVKHARQVAELAVSLCQ